MFTKWLVVNSMQTALKVHFSTTHMVSVLVILSVLRNLYKRWRIRNKTLTTKLLKLFELFYHQCVNNERTVSRYTVNFLKLHIRTSTKRCISLKGLSYLEQTLASSSFISQSHFLSNNQLQHAYFLLYQLPSPYSALKSFMKEDARSDVTGHGTTLRPFSYIWRRKTSRTLETVVPSRDIRDRCAI